MPYFNFTEEIPGSKSRATFLLSASAAEGISSSRAADSTGESSSSETFKSNYAKLPGYLKSCLDYSASVGSVEIRKLVRLLLAEGLIQDKPGDIMVDVAANVVRELFDLGMLQEIRDGSKVGVPNSYRQFISIIKSKQDFVSRSANSPIWLRIRDDGSDIYPNVEGLLIQSLYIHIARHRQSSFDPPRGLSRAYMRNVCAMQSLLVLDLHGKIEYLPDEVGDLIHLRYLGLVNSNLNELPRALGNLKRLQTLDIRGRGARLKLPIEILHIQQLRHLLMSIRYYDRGIRVPEGIGTLVNLRTLDGIYGGDGIAIELSALTQLRELGVMRVSEDHASELFAAIKKMENLTYLSLDADRSYYIKDTNGLTLFPELNAFSPPPLLQEFTLVGGLIEMPEWLASMENLTRLHLGGSYLSENPSSVLQLLPKLKHLFLREAYKAKHIGKEFCNAGGFPVLETLTIASEFLVEWTEIVTGAFPRLRYLHFVNCKSLIFLPEGLQNISTLQELDFFPLHPDLARRLEAEENYKIKHVPIFTKRIEGKRLDSTFLVGSFSTL